MKYYPILEGNKKKTGFLLFLFVQLLLCRDTLISSCLVGFLPSQVTAAILICVMGISFLIKSRSHLKEILEDKRILVFVATGAIMLLPLVVKMDLQAMYFSILLCIFFAVFLTYFVTLKEVAKYYVLIITLLAVYSVFAVYLGRIPVDRGIISIHTFSNAGGRGFYNFLLSFVSISQVRFRNFGIFREPGVYQFFLITALILNTYTIQWDRAWKYWCIQVLLVLTTLTTFSTNGVVEVCLFLLVIFFDKKLYRDKRICVAAIGMIALAAAIVAVILMRGGDLAFTLKQMLAKLYTLNRSSSARLNAIVTDAKYFLRNPLFGEKISVVLGALEFNTTSTMLMFAMFGIGGGMLHLVSWLALIWSRDRKRWVNMALILIVLLSFNTQNLTTNLFFWLFPVMALTERVVPILNIKTRK